MRPLQRSQMHGQGVVAFWNAVGGRHPLRTINCRASSGSAARPETNVPPEETDDEDRAASHPTAALFGADETADVAAVLVATAYGERLAMHDVHADTRERGGPVSSAGCHHTAGSRASARHQRVR